MYAYYSSVEYVLNMNIICIHIIYRYCGHSSPVTAAAFSCDGLCGRAGVGVRVRVRVRVCV